VIVPSPDTHHLLADAVDGPVVDDDHEDNGSADAPWRRHRDLVIVEALLHDEPANGVVCVAWASRRSGEERVVADVAVAGLGVEARVLAEARHLRDAGMR
jgi:hypothetical protein